MYNTILMILAAASARNAHFRWASSAPLLRTLLEKFWTVEERWPSISILFVRGLYKNDTDPIASKWSMAFFDKVNKLIVAPSLKLVNGDSLVTTFTAGSRTYSNVIFHWSDTTLSQTPNPIYNMHFVWTSYYTKGHGIVAFYDLKTRSLFYRQWQPGFSSVTRLADIKNLPCES